MFIRLKYDDKMTLLETLPLPKSINEGWGLARDWNRPGIVYISDGSHVIYECEVNSNFKVIRQHKVT